MLLLGGYQPWWLDQEAYSTAQGGQTSWGELAGFGLKCNRYPYSRVMDNMNRFPPSTLTIGMS